MLSKTISEVSSEAPFMARGGYINNGIVVRSVNLFMVISYKFAIIIEYITEIILHILLYTYIHRNNIKNISKLISNYIDVF